MANGIFKKIGGIFTTEQTDTHPLPATDTQKKEKVVKAKKRNERAYERYRGRGGNSKPIPEHIGEGLEIRILPERSKRNISSVIKEFYLDGLHYFYIYNIGKEKITEEFMVPLIIE